MFPGRDSRVLFASLLSVWILLIPKPFLGDSPAAVIPTKLPGRDALLMGTDWYPEQWPESRWEADLQMIEAVHLQVVRVRRVCVEPHGAIGRPI